MTDLLFCMRAYLPHGMWDLSSSTRDRTCGPCLAKWILNHWTTREDPLCGLLSMSLYEMLPSTSAHILLAVGISFVNCLLACPFPVDLYVFWMSPLSVGNIGYIGQQGGPRQKPQATCGAHTYSGWVFVVQSLSRVRLFATLWTAAHQASLSITNSQSLLKLMSIESRMPSNHLILCSPLLLLPSIIPSIRVFSNESGLRIRWSKYWSFSLSISPSNEYSGLISFTIDWFNLLAVQETLNSLLQHHSSKASILRCSAFFMVQLSHPYMTTGKTIALTLWIFLGKVISLLFNMLSGSYTGCI